MTEAKIIAEALGEIDERVMPSGPWPSDAELEFRQRLTAIEARIAALESHQLRSDKLVTEVQMEVRRSARAQTSLGLRIESKIEGIANFLRGNGHG